MTTPITTLQFLCVLVSILILIAGFIILIHINRTKGIDLTKRELTEDGQTMFNGISQADINIIDTELLNNKKNTEEENKFMEDYYKSMKDLE